MAATCTRNGGNYATGGCLCTRVLRRDSDGKTARRASNNIVGAVIYRLYGRVSYRRGTRVDRGFLGVTMFGDFANLIFDEIGSIFNGGQKRIVFTCVPAFTPYEVVQYLEGLGVKVKPKSHVEMDEDGTRTATIYVTEGQYLYAAGLVAGMAPGAVAVMEPHTVRPVAPRTSWGKPNRSARGPVASFLRTASIMMGSTSRVPPKKGRK